MTKKLSEVEERIKFIFERYGVDKILLIGLVNMAKEEVEVPNCSDCEHKRFHEDPRRN